MGDAGAAIPGRGGTPGGSGRGGAARGGAPGGLGKAGGAKRGQSVPPRARPFSAPPAPGNDHPGRRHPASRARGLPAELLPRGGAARPGSALPAGRGLPRRRVGGSPFSRRFPLPRRARCGSVRPRAAFIRFGTAPCAARCPAVLAGREADGCEAPTDVGPLWRSELFESALLRPERRADEMRCVPWPPAFRSARMLELFLS